MKFRVTVNVKESGDVEVPDEIAERGYEAIYDYLHDLSGNPWGQMNVDMMSVNVHRWEIRWEENQ